MVIGRLKLPMELCCGSDEAAFASKLAVCLITSTPPLTGLKPAYDENCLGIKQTFKTLWTIFRPQDFMPKGQFYALLQMKIKQGQLLSKPALPKKTTKT